MRGSRSLHAAARVRLATAPARRGPPPLSATASAAPSLSSSSSSSSRRCFSASARQGQTSPSSDETAPSPSSSSSSSSSSPSDDTAPEVPPAGAVIFSGIQPTGVPHLGNYFGALQRWVQLQDTAAGASTSASSASSASSAFSSSSKPTSLYYSVVDLHALTKVGAHGTPGDVLRQRRREMLATFLAVGLDPDRSVLFYQSDVPAHAALMWMLSCTASVGYLSRMTQWKSKLNLDDDVSVWDPSARGARGALKLGLFSYPVLQAADILVHRATHVPVGADQCQHLEFARELAISFNHAHKPVQGSGGGDGGSSSTSSSPLLIPPQTLLSPARRVMSLQNAAQKMSKSHHDPRSRIVLTDDADTIVKKFLKARTDNQNVITYDPAQRPAVANLLEILVLADGDIPPGGLSSAEVTRRASAAAADMEGLTLKDLKLQVASAVVHQLDGMRRRFVDALERDGGRYLDRVAEHGAKKARANAEETMEAVRAAIGL